MAKVIYEHASAETCRRVFRVEPEEGEGPIAIVGADGLPRLGCKLVCVTLEAVPLDDGRSFDVVCHYVPERKDG